DEGRLGVDEVAQAERDGDGVEGVVGEREPQRVGGHHWYTAVTSPAQHAEREVGGHTPGPTPGVFLGGDPGSSREVEYPLAGTGIQHPTRDDAPSPVETERHHGVRAVVAFGDAIEHRRDVGRILVQARSGHAGSLKCVSLALRSGRGPRRPTGGNRPHEDRGYHTDPATAADFDNARSLVRKNHSSGAATSHVISRVLATGSNVTNHVRPATLASSGSVVSYSMRTSCPAVSPSG